MNAGRRDSAEIMSKLLQGRCGRRACRNQNQEGDARHPRALFLVLARRPESGSHVSRAGRAWRTEAITAGRQAPQKTPFTWQGAGNIVGPPERHCWWGGRMALKCPP